MADESVQCLVLLPAMLCNEELYNPQIEAVRGVIEALPLVVAEASNSGLGFLTPHDVHYGLAEQRVAARGDCARHRLCGASGTIPRRSAPPPGAFRGSLNQPTQDASD